MCWGHGENRWDHWYLYVCFLTCQLSWLHQQRLLGLNQDFNRVTEEGLSWRAPRQCVYWDLWAQSLNKTYPRYLVFCSIFSDGLFFRADYFLGSQQNWTEGTEISPIPIPHICTASPTVWIQGHLILIFLRSLNSGLTRNTHLFLWFIHLTTFGKTNAYWTPPIRQVFLLTHFHLNLAVSLKAIDCKHSKNYNLG